MKTKNNRLSEEASHQPKPINSKSLDSRNRIPSVKDNVNKQSQYVISSMGGRMVLYTLSRDGKKSVQPLTPKLLKEIQNETSRIRFLKMSKTQINDIIKVIGNDNINVIGRSMQNRAQIM